MLFHKLGVYPNKCPLITPSTLVTPVRTNAAPLGLSTSFETPRSQANSIYPDYYNIKLQSHFHPVSPLSFLCLL